MTLNDQDLFEQLDQYSSETLSADEQLVLEERMKNDATFKQKVDEYLRLIEALKQYGNREMLKVSLDTYHHDVINDSAQNSSQNFNSSAPHWKAWQTIAVAASVAFISIVATIITTRSLEKDRKADYKELRKNVDQIKKSQKAIMADIREVKEKEDPFPGNYEGTGFLISSDGYVATSCHVIRDADSLYLENKKFGRLKANVVKADIKNDVAILKIEQASFNALIPYNISANEADIGENVFTLGFPREDIVYGEGTISSSTGYGRNVHAYQIAVPVNPGNSGGPLLNKQGQLVGIISGLQTETLGAAFAIKSSVLLSVIGNTSGDSLALPVRVPKQNRIKYLSRVEQIKKLQDVIFVVRVYNSKQ